MCRRYGHWSSLAAVWRGGSWEGGSAEGCSSPTLQVVRERGQSCELYDPALSSCLPTHTVLCQPSQTSPRAYEGQHDSLSHRHHPWGCSWTSAPGNGASRLPVGNADPWSTCPFLCSVNGVNRLSSERIAPQQSSWTCGRHTWPASLERLRK